MQSFEGRIAVVTGGGTGMGRELAVQLAGAGAHVAMCDVHLDDLAETADRCRAADGSVRVTTHECDVSDESALERFRAEIEQQHDTDHVHLLFNNAGIGGGGSFVDQAERARWERTFDVCWNGVYLASRVFVPMVIAADEGHIVNTSSINGFWASLGPSRPHTAYSAAKFAVRGFTEALMTDLRLHAPHVGVSVVMPGHIGTDIVTNSRQVLGVEVDAEMTEIANAFRNQAPTTAAEAAGVILDGVRAGRWRILIGEDAHAVDSLVREQPEGAYETGFVEQLHAMGVLDGIVG